MMSYDIAALAEELIHVVRVFPIIAVEVGFAPFLRANHDHDAGILDERAYLGFPRLSSGEDLQAVGGADGGCCP